VNLRLKRYREQGEAGALDAPDRIAQGQGSVDRGSEP
jgi:hypothetical protein